MLNNIGLRLQLLSLGGKLYQFNFWYNGSGYSGGKTTLEAFYGTAQTAAAMTTAIGSGIIDANTTKYKEYKPKIHTFCFR